MAVVSVSVMGNAMPELCQLVGIWAVGLDTSEKFLCSCLVASNDGTRAVRNIDGRRKGKRVVGIKRHIVQV